MIVRKKVWLGLLGSFIAMMVAIAPASAQQQQRRPNILVIMGDDVGWFNIGAYHPGVKSGEDAKPRQACSRRNAIHRLLC